jgi:hypothetical protein
MENEDPFSVVTSTDAAGFDAGTAFWLFEGALSIRGMSVAET